MNPTNSRRNFLKSIAAFSIAAPTLLTVLKSEFVFAQELKPVDPADAMATALGYHEVATKVDKVKWSKYAAPQQCSSCMLYTGGGQKAAGSDKEWGKCQIFPGKLVAPAGWCNSWVAKPE